jgi:DnaD/phage-associated family protein
MQREIQQFNGFPAGKTRIIGIPSEFFSDLLPLIDDAAELKLTLFALWALQQKDRDDYRYLRREDFTAASVRHMHGLMDDAALDAVLERCVARGTLLCVQVDARVVEGGCLYFANSPAGRSAVEQIAQGAWLPGDLTNPVQLLPERPNIYKLYEENIGALTPLISDDLKDTAEEFGVEWLSEAIQISVQMEKRNMKYIRAILERWKKEGRKHDRQHEVPAGHAKPNGKQSIFGSYADFFER